MAEEDDSEWRTSAPISTLPPPSWAALAVSVIGSYNPTMTTNSESGLINAQLTSENLPQHRYLHRIHHMPRFKIKGRKRSINFHRRITHKSRVTTDSDEDKEIEDLNRKRKAQSEPNYDASDSDSDESVNSKIMNRKRRCLDYKRWSVNYELGEGSKQKTKKKKKKKIVKMATTMAMSTWLTNGGASLNKTPISSSLTLITGSRRPLSKNSVCFTSVNSGLLRSSFLSPSNLHSSSFSGLSMGLDLGTNIAVGTGRGNRLVVRAGKAALCQTKRSRSRKSLARTHGFRLRMRSTGGRALLQRRRAKGRKILCTKTNPSSGKGS